MWVQTIGIAIIAVTGLFARFAAGAVMLCVGTAMVYPTFLAAIGEMAHPSGAHRRPASDDYGAISAMPSAPSFRGWLRTWSESRAPCGWSQH